MKSDFSIALLISTYNNPIFLGLVLDSVLNQTITPNEIVIADDGSKADTKELIDSYRNKLNCKIKHVWHKDDGFRKCKILNKSIAQISSDYILQIDGDVILHSQFIEDHLKAVHFKQLVCGNRCFIRKKRTYKLLQNPTNKRLNILSVRKRKRFFRIPRLSKLFKNRRSKTSRKGNIGCHLAYWKEDIVKINGYNEDFTGWGYEDIEMVERLMNSGVKKTTLLLMALQYHLYHPKSSRKSSQKNKKQYYLCRDQKLSFCDNGINKYINSDNHNVRFPTY